MTPTVIEQGQHVTVAAGADRNPPVGLVCAHRRPDCPPREARSRRSRPIRHLLASTMPSLYGMVEVLRGSAIRHHASMTHRSRDGDSQLSRARPPERTAVECRPPLRPVAEGPAAVTGRRSGGDAGACLAARAVEDVLGGGAAHGRRRGDVRGPGGSDA